MTTSTPYTVLGQAVAFEKYCESWVEQQLGVSTKLPNAIAGITQKDFIPTNDPSQIPAGVAVVFGAAQSNGYQGHVGVSTGNGMMKSVWNNGNIVSESIAQFAKDNGTSVLGYHNYGRGIMSTLTDAISTATSDARVRLAMLTGAALEGGSLAGPWQPGDQGTSFGPFQIHLPAHPGVTAAQASDPNFAVKYMLPAYQQAVAQVGAKLWASDPQQAAAQAAYIAERPAQMYDPSRVTTAFAQAISAQTQPSTGVTNTSTTASTNALPDITIPLPWGGTTSIPNPLNALAGGLARAFFLIVGILIIVIGLWLMVQGSKEQ